MGTPRRASWALLPGPWAQLRAHLAHPEGSGNPEGLKLPPSRHFSGSKRVTRPPADSLRDRLRAELPTPACALCPSCPVTCGCPALGMKWEEEGQGNQGPGPCLQAGGRGANSRGGGEIVLCLEAGSFE